MCFVQRMSNPSPWRAICQTARMSLLFECQTPVPTTNVKPHVPTTNVKPQSLVQRMPNFECPYIRNCQTPVSLQRMPNPSVPTVLWDAKPQCPYNECQTPCSYVRMSILWVPTYVTAKPQCPYNEMFLYPSPYNECQTPCPYNECQTPCVLYNECQTPVSLTTNMSNCTHVPTTNVKPQSLQRMSNPSPYNECQTPVSLQRMSNIPYTQYFESPY